MVAVRLPEVHRHDLVFHALSEQEASARIELGSRGEEGRGVDPDEMRRLCDAVGTTTLTSAPDLPSFGVTPEKKNQTGDQEDIEENRTHRSRPSGSAKPS